MGADLSKLAGRALAFDAARRETLRLRRERNACRCECEELPEPEVGSTGVEACWKRWEMIDFEDGRGMVGDRLDPIEWCEACRRREALHRAYCASLPRMASAQRSLYAACASYRQTVSLDPKA